MFLPVSCFFQCPELTIPVFLTVGECPLCTLFFSLSWLDPSCASHSWWVPLACISFIVLTWPLCALSLSVSWLGPSHVLDSWWVPLCGLFLSVSWLDLSHALNRLWVPCVVCFCWPSLYAWQEVSTPFFFQCPELAIPVCSTVAQCPSHSLFLSMSWLHPSCVLNKLWVPLPWSLSFIASFTLPMLLTDHDFPSCGLFFSASWLDCALDSWWVPLACVFFSVLTLPVHSTVGECQWHCSWCACGQASFVGVVSDVESHCFVVFVVPLALSVSFSVLTWLPLCTRQLVCTCAQ